ncbi:MAG: hypothetical protein Q9198_007035, partial [Flavoplaca austrocitrina]
MALAQARAMRVANIQLTDHGCTVHSASLPQVSTTSSAISNPYGPKQKQIPPNQV